MRIVNPLRTMRVLPLRTWLASLLRRACPPLGLRCEIVPPAEPSTASGENVPAFLRGVWPPTWENLHILGVFVVAVWLCIIYALRSTKKDASEEQHERRRLQQILDQLTQVALEQKENAEKRAVYLAKKASLEEAAAKKAETEGSDAGELFKVLAVETGFAAETLEAPLAPARFLDALIDDLEDKPLDTLPGLHAKLQALGDVAPVAAAAVEAPAAAAPLTPVALFQQYFTEMHALLLQRQAEVLKEVVEKTADALANPTDASQHAYASGTKLEEALDSAKKVHKHFFQRRLFGLVEPPSRPKAKEHEATFCARYAEATAQHRMARRQQKGRLVTLVSYLRLSTLGWMGLLVLKTLFFGMLHPLTQVYQAKIASDALLADELWQRAVKQDLLVLVVLFVADWWVADFISLVGRSKVNQEFTTDLRQQLFRAIMRQDTIFFEMRSSAEVQQAINGDCNEICENFLHKPLELLGALTHLVSAVVYLHQSSPHMLRISASAAALTLPIMYVAESVSDLLRRKAELRDERVLQRIRDKTSEMFESLQTVREFAREEQEQVDYDRNEVIKTRLALVTQVVGSVQPLIFTLNYGATFLCMWHGAGQVHARTLEPSAMVSLTFMCMHITFTMRHLLYLIPEMLKLALPAERVFALLESRSLIEPMPGAAAAPFEPCRGGVQIVFNEVSFSYPTLQEHLVLRKLSLTVPAGKTVALVGERGCGKSTTIQLMKRMYDPEPGAGTITLNGRPMAEWDVRSYRRHISVVAQSSRQSVQLFNGTIKENVLYGLSDEDRRARGFDGELATTAGHAELRRVCELACCWDFVSAFPLKLETRIGTRGVKLSGGQTQCIAIARALVKQPALLILDEATSALDAATQKAAAANIAKEQAAHGFTVVQIAHRLETLTNSDVVYYMVHGTVVEVGGEQALEQALEPTPPGGQATAKAKRSGEIRRDSAVDELLKVKIHYESVADPADAEKQVQKLQTGHFHRMWNLAHDKKDWEKMTQLEVKDRIKELKAEMDEADAYLEEKNKKVRARFFGLRNSIHASAALRGALRDAPRGAPSVLLPQRARSEATRGSDPAADAPGAEEVPVLSVLRQCTSPGKPNNDGFKAVAREESAKAMASEQSSS